MNGDLGPAARAIVEGGRAGDDPTEADRARVKAALMLSLAGGAAAASAASAAGSASSAGAAKGASTAGAVAKVIAALAIAGAVVGIISIGLQPPAAKARSGEALGASLPAREVEDAARELEEPDVGAAAAPTTNADPAAAVIAATKAPGGAKASGGALRQEGASVTAASSSKVMAKAAAASTGSTLEAETRKLREAHSAMRSGDPARALELLDEQSTAFAGGELRQERAAARVLALCQAGRAAEASAESARFLRDNPSSPLADRVRAACATPPKSALEKDR
jgi:hypothetical protein